MKNILVVGPTGNLGPHIVKALVDKGHHVSALLRSSSINDPSKTTPLKEQGVELIEGSLEDYDSLLKACQGKDVVLSCAGGDQLMNQVQLAKAAKAAGVERFVPSEFGVDPYIAGQGSCDLFDAKAAVQTQLKEMGIDFTPIYTNGFMEFWATGLGQLGPQSPPDQVQIYGTGDTVAQVTALGDIGRYTAEIIDDPGTINKEVLIATNRATQHEMIDLWEELSGKKVKKEYVSGEQLNEIIDTSTTPETMPTRIFTQLHRSVWIRDEASKQREGVLNAVERYPRYSTSWIKSVLRLFSVILN